MSVTPPTLLVMAAGLGSRYQGLKQIDRLGPTGERLIDYAVFDARRAGFGRVVFIISRGAADAFADLARELPAALDIGWVYQDPDRLPEGFTPPPRTKPWGTVHAVLSARGSIDTPFAVLNADDFYGAEAYRLALGACTDAGRSGSYAVIGLPLERTLSDRGPVVRAVCAIDDGFVTRLDEVYGVQRTPKGIHGTTAEGNVHHLAGHAVASMNFWVFTPAIFVQLDDRFSAFLRARGHEPDAELPLPVAVDELIRSGQARVRALEAPGPWFGLTHRTDRERVIAGLRDLTARGDYPSPLWSTTTY